MHAVKLSLVAVLLSLTAAACGGAKASGPAWPRSAGTVVPDDGDEDGGESLEPRTSAAVAAVEKADEKADEVVPAKTDDGDDDEAKKVTTTVTDPTAPPPGEVELELEEILFEEEIIIEED